MYAYEFHIDNVDDEIFEFFYRCTVTGYPTLFKSGSHLFDGPGGKIERPSTQSPKDLDQIREEQEEDQEKERNEDNETTELKANISNGNVDDIYGDRHERDIAMAIDNDWVNPNGNEYLD